MTDKEQIIIDEVDVSGCILRRRKEANCTVCNGYSSKVFEFDCSDFKNCYYKQLARKTAECEQYEQACDKIKEVCLEDTHTFADGTKLRYDSLDDILDIISKTKDGNNDR